LSEKRLMLPSRNTGHKRALDVTSVVQGKTRFFSVMMLTWGMYCIVPMLPFSKLKLITLVVLLRASCHYVALWQYIYFKNLKMIYQLQVW
jgi:hypothetical protein